MPTRRPAETTPDLFSASPTVTAAERSAVPKGKAGPDSLASQQRHFLPKDLAGALKRLDDVEIDALLAAVTTEAERRGRRPPSPAKEKPIADAKSQRRQEAGEAFIDHWQAECSACSLQGRRQAVCNRKAIWNFAIRCQEGTGAGHASRSLIWSVSPTSCVKPVTSFRACSPSVRYPLGNPLDDPQL